MARASSATSAALMSGASRVPPADSGAPGMSNARKPGTETSSMMSGPPRSGPAAGSSAMPPPMIRTVMDQSAQLRQELAVGLDVAVHVGVRRGNAGGGARARERFPHAAVGQPDPHQPGELVVGERVRLGPGARLGPVPLPGAGTEPDRRPRQAGRADGCLDPVGELAAQGRGLLVG